MNTTTQPGPLEVRLSDQLGLVPERATCERCAFMHAATREAQEYASRYADEVLELRAQVAWQPIKTAPRDGTTVLLAAPGRLTVGEWRAEQWPTASEYHSSTGEYLGQYETGECVPAGWYSWDGGFTDEDPPTHWMPLPAPPVSA